MPLPMVVLPLIQIAVLRGGDEFLRLGVRVGVVRLAAAGERDHRAVVEVVVPQGVDREPSRLDRTHQTGVLRLVLGDHDRLPAGRCFADTPADRGDDVFRRRIEDLLRRIETQAVKMELVDPVPGVRDEEFAHRRGVRSVEVDRVAPLVLVAIGEIRGREIAKIVSCRPEMVVDDVEDDADAERVRAIHETPQIVGPAVQPRRRKQIDAVVAPPESALELGDGHHLDDRDAAVRELRQLRFRGRPRAFTRERAHVELVNHLALKRHARPRHVGPFERARVDDFRRPMRPLGLKSGRRIGIAALALVEAKSVAHASPGIHDAAEVSALFCVERCHGSTVNRHVHTASRRRPHAKMRLAVRHRLAADRQPPAGRRFRNDRYAAGVGKG